MLKPTRRLTKKKMKEDKLVTSYFKFIDYINQNSKLVSGVMIGIAAIVVIGYLFIQSKKSAESSASVALTKARVEISNSNPETAIDILRSIIDNYSGTRGAGKSVFYLANIFYDKGEYEEAQNYYKKYLDDYDNDIILSSSSYSGIGACLEQKGEYLEAASYYKKGAHKHAKHFEAPEQLMSAARCFKRANNNIEAQKIYQSIIDNYPKSQYKRNAEIYLSELQG